MDQQINQQINNKFEEFTNRVQYSDYIMPFGKYKGCFVSDVIREDKSYFNWLLPKVDGELQKAMLFIKKEYDNE